MELTVMVLFRVGLYPKNGVDLIVDQLVESIFVSQIVGYFIVYY